MVPASMLMRSRCPVWKMAGASTASAGTSRASSASSKVAAKLAATTAPTPAAASAAAAAARALAAAGVIAVVAGSFAEGFAEAVLAAGVPPLEVDAPAIFHSGQRMRLNLEAGTIANLSSGDRQPIRNLTDALLERLRSRLGQ